jgi:hypothetical protein
MVEQVVQCSLELVVEVVEVCVLIDVQVEEVTEDVVVVFKLEVVVALIQCLDHLQCSHGRRRQWRSNFEYLNLDIVGNRHEQVQLDVPIFLHPSSSFLQESWLWV